MGISLFTILALSENIIDQSDCQIVTTFGKGTFFGTPFTNATQRNNNTFLAATSSSSSDSVTQSIRLSVRKQFLNFVALCSFDHVEYMYAGD